MPSFPGPEEIRTATAPVASVLPRGFDLARGRRVEPAKREATVLKKVLHNKPYHVSLLRPISPLSCSAAGTREELCGIGSRHAWRRREARTPTHQGAHGARPHLSQGRPRVSSLSLVRYRNNDCSVPTRHGLQEVLAKGYVDRVRDRLSRKFTLGRNVFARPRPKPESGDRFSHLRNAGIRACGPAVGAGTQIGVRRDNQGENPATMRMRMRRCWDDERERRSPTGVGGILRIYDRSDVFCWIEQCQVLCCPIAGGEERFHPTPR